MINIFHKVKKPLCVLATFIAISSQSVFADIAVIVHPSNNNTLTASQIKKIYLGQLKVYPDNSRITAFDHEEGSLIKEMFSSAVLKKNKQQLKSYWARRIFTGTGTPPDALDSDEDIKKAVAKDPTAIGYIDAANIKDDVKVVYRF